MRSPKQCYQAAAQQRLISTLYNKSGFVPLLGSFTRNSPKGLCLLSVPGQIIGEKHSWLTVKYRYPFVVVLICVIHVSKTLW